MKTVLIADADFVFAKQLSRALEESGRFQVIDITLISFNPLALGLKTSLNFGI